jgi:hypothetical protein
LRRRRVIYRRRRRRRTRERGREPAFFIEEEEVYIQEEEKEEDDCTQAPNASASPHRVCHIQPGDQHPVLCAPAMLHAPCSSDRTSHLMVSSFFRISQ